MAICPTLPLELSAVDVTPQTESLISGSTINHRLYYRQRSKDVQLQSGTTAGGAMVINSLLLLPVGTKVATIGNNGPIGAGRGELGAEAIRRSALASLQRMGLVVDQGRAAEGITPEFEQQGLQWLIAQRPDVGVSLEEIAGGFSGLVREGAIKEVRNRTLVDNTELRLVGSARLSSERH
jgi:hypothetical protein